VYLVRQAGHIQGAVSLGLRELRAEGFAMTLPANWTAPAYCPGCSNGDCRWCDGPDRDPPISEAKQQSLLGLSA